MPDSKHHKPTAPRRPGMPAGRPASMAGFLIVLALLLAACGSGAAPVGQPPTGNTPTAPAIAAATNTPAPTATSMPAPTSAPAATATPAPVAQPTATAGYDYGPQPETPTATPAAEASPTPSSGLAPSVTVADQALVDGGVTVAEVVSDGPGWIVIHAQADGKPGPVLGYSPLSSGVNRDVAVKIDLTGATATLYAMLHTDGGTVGTWEFPGPDTPVTVDGQVVTPAFQLQALSGEAEIEIEDFAFHPKVLVIRAGTTVKWANKDNIQHTSTSDNNVWDSGYLSKGDTFSFTFAEPGVYPYYCIPHGGPGGQGMSGTVVVLK